MRFSLPWIELALPLSLLTALAAWAESGSARTPGLLAWLLVGAAAWAFRALAPDARRGPGAAALAAGWVCTASLAGGLEEHNAGLLAVRVASGVLAALLWVLGPWTPPEHRPPRERFPWRIALVFPLLAALLARGLPAGFRALLALATAAGLWLLGVDALVRSADPRERARHRWPVLGLSAALCCGLSFLPALLGLQPEPLQAAPWAALAVASVSVGHALGLSGRAVGAALLAGDAALSLLLGAFVGLWLWDARRASWALFAGLVAGLAAHLWRQQARAERERNGLLGACAVASAALAGAEREEELAAALLGPLRAACGEPTAAASLWVLEGAQRYELDVSGAARVHPLSLEGARGTLLWLRAHPLEPTLRAVLEQRVVRHPEARAALAALEEHNALCALPLSDNVDLLAVAFVPKGRLGAMDEREFEALGELSRRAAAALARVQALTRAQRRAEEATSGAADASARKEGLERAVRDWGARWASLGAALHPRSPALLWVGYSEAMRALDAELRALASARGFLGVCAEAGVSLLPLAHRLAQHAGGAPVLSLDASTLEDEALRECLFGAAEQSPGWLGQEGAQVLLLENAHAMGPAASARLVRYLDGLAPNASAPHLVLAAPSLALAERIPQELKRHQRGSWLTAPPLRERAEDLETLVLLGLDAAARREGRETLGISREALELLRRWHWPGNEAELALVLAQLAREVPSVRVGPVDLPSRVRGAEEEEGVLPANASYDEMERRLLEAALARVGGNKSEAARVLGLPRTTLLDKLRKYGLRD